MVNSQGFTLCVCVCERAHVFMHACGCTSVLIISLSICVRLHRDILNILLYCQNKCCNHYWIRFRSLLPCTVPYVVWIFTFTYGTVVIYSKSYWKLSITEGKFYHFQILAGEYSIAVTFSHCSRTAMKQWSSNQWRAESFMQFNTQLLLESQSNSFNKSTVASWHQLRFVI